MSLVPVLCANLIMGLRNVASQGTPSEDSGLGAILFLVCSTGNWDQIKQYLFQSILSLDRLIIDSFSSLSLPTWGQDLALKMKPPNPSMFGYSCPTLPLSGPLLRLLIPDPRPISYFDHVPLAVIHHLGQTPCLGLPGPLPPSIDLDQPTGFQPDTALSTGPRWSNNLMEGNRAGGSGEAERWPQDLSVSVL